MKYKQFIVGFVTCVILLSVIFVSGFAEDALTVVLNRFPIFINGQEEPVEAYNINGFTFLKLADVGKAIPGTTIKFNEIDERIEINIVEASLPETMDESEVMSMSTAIEYDSVTGLPVGAEYVENEKDGRKYKTIQYNNKIFISESDMKDIYGIKYIRNLNSLNIVYGKDEQEVTVDFMQRENVLKVNTRGYINIALFNQIIGE
jgi:hypothetical protein